jgi:hypothetical protein
VNLLLQKRHTLELLSLSHTGATYTRGGGDDDDDDDDDDDVRGRE